MKDFLASLSSLYWWLSVVVVGLLINLSSAYLKSRLDSSLYRRSSRRRAQAEARNKARKQAVEKLRSNPDAQYLLSAAATRELIHGLEFIVLGTLCIVLRIILTVTPVDSPTWWPFGPPFVTYIVRIMQFVFIFLFVVCLLTSFRFHSAYFYNIRLLSDARNEVAG